MNSRLGVCGAKLKKGSGTCHSTAIYDNGRCRYHGGRYFSSANFALEDAVRAILKSIGEDTDREGLLETPSRVARAFRELTQGYGQDPIAILGKIFTDPEYDAMVIVKDIPFTSLCEHHLLGFSGKAAIAYIPQGGRIVGLSKLARLLECFARRLQVQERLTTQVAKALMNHTDLQPLGVGVIIASSHSCMAMRGIQREAMTITDCLLGTFRDDQKVREEFIQLYKN